MSECIKIIIDNQLNDLEEPKQETLENIKQFEDCIRTLDENFAKQETLEEVKPMRELVVFLDRIKKNLTNKNEVTTIQIIIDTIKNEFFEKVSKWQQEQDKNKYSDEDMLNFAWFLIENIGQYSCDRTAHFEGKYLEQFKKK
jgi:biotin synthase-related radical SAM superfamily protein